MSQSRFAEALNGQIAYEFGASQQYVAIAVYYDAETLPRLAAHFYQQSLEDYWLKYQQDKGGDLAAGLAGVDKDVNNSLALVSGP